MKKQLVIAGIVVIVLSVLLLFSTFFFPLVILAGAILLKLKYPEIKGAVGERYVNRILAQLGPGYQVYQDLYLPNKHGGTTQIDHVVTSPFGVFVIETKHYDGWIFGQEHQKNWTQVIYKSKKKFYNPIFQNNGHIRALKSYLGKEDVDFHSIIAFSHRSTFKFQDPFQSARVIHFKDLVNVIKESKEHQLSQAELHEINRALARLTIIDKKEKRQVKKRHVQGLKTNQSQKALAIEQSSNRNVCPKCGGDLALKKGKYGSFYGCSNFPKCRFTRKVS